MLTVDNPGQFVHNGTVSETSTTSGPFNYEVEVIATNEAGEAVLLVFEGKAASKGAAERTAVAAAGTRGFTSAWASRARVK